MVRVSTSAESNGFDDVQGIVANALPRSKLESASQSGGGRRPNLHETRFMAYDAIVHGANAILYWNTNAIEKQSELWQHLMSVSEQIRALEPAIVGQRPKHAPAATGEETFASVDGQGPRLMLRKSEDDWVLIAVNEVSTGIAFEVNGLPSELNDKTLYRLYSDESHTVDSGRFRDGIYGLDVHIYATSRRFEVK